MYHGPPSCYKEIDLSNQMEVINLGGIDKSHVQILCWVSNEKPYFIIVSTSTSRMEYRFNPGPPSSTEGHLVRISPVENPGLRCSP